MSAKWTFMVYVAGYNNLSPFATKDLEEMRKVGSTDEVKVAAFSGPFPALQFQTDESGGKRVITHVLVTESETGGSGGSGGGGSLQSNLFSGQGQRSGIGSGPSGTSQSNQRMMQYTRQHSRSREVKPRNQTKMLPVGEVGGKKPAVGVLPSRVADFTLDDPATGKPWSLADSTRDAKATVVVFTATGCPVCAAYWPKLADLGKRYGEQGVAFVEVDLDGWDTEDIFAHS